MMRGRGVVVFEHDCIIKPRPGNIRPRMLALLDHDVWIIIMIWPEGQRKLAVMWLRSSTRQKHQHHHRLWGRRNIIIVIIMYYGRGRRTVSFGFGQHSQELFLLSQFLHPLQLPEPLLQQIDRRKSNTAATTMKLISISFPHHCNSILFLKWSTNWNF